MTHKKIAELAHVSVSTVSKALSGSKEVSRELTEEIKRIAFETGYFQEKSKRRLMYEKNQQVLIAVICPEVISIQYSRMIESVKREAEKRNGRISVYIDDFDARKTNEIVQSIAVRNEADGILIFSSAELKEKINLPVVYFGHPEQGEQDIIDCDMHAVFRDIVAYLKDLGHTDIGFMGESNTHEKNKAYRQAMAEAGLPVREEHVYILDKRFEEIGYAAAEQMTADLPTAVIAAYDEVALAAMHALEQRGVRVPEEISFVGINNIPSAEYFHIPLTTVEVFSDRQSEMAVEILFERIFGEPSERKQILLPHQLICRKSVKAV